MLLLLLILDLCDNQSVNQVPFLQLAYIWISMSHIVSTEGTKIPSKVEGSLSYTINICSKLVYVSLSNHLNWKIVLKHDSLEEYFFHIFYKMHSLHLWNLWLMIITNVCIIYTTCPADLFQLIKSIERHGYLPCLRSKKSLYSSDRQNRLQLCQGYHISFYQIWKCIIKTTPNITSA